MMDTRLLEILACPSCQAKLVYDKKKQELVCRFEHIAFPIKNNVPELVMEQARILKSDEVN